MDPQKLLLPGSIVLAGAMMGAGLYFGLSAQARDAAHPAAPGEAAPQDERPSSPDRRIEPAPAQPPVEPAALRPPGPPPDPIPAEVRAAASEQATAALAKHRPRLIKECWEPSAKKAATPAKVTIPIRILFDAQGKATNVAAGDPSEPGREDVAACVRASQLPFSIKPPGQLVGVQLMLTMP